MSTLSNIFYTPSSTRPNQTKLRLARMDLNYIGSTQEIVEMVNLQESIRAKCITYLERAEKLKEYIKVVVIDHQLLSNAYEAYGKSSFGSLLFVDAENHVGIATPYDHCYSLFRGTEWVSSFLLEC